MAARWEFLYLLPQARFDRSIEYGPLALVPHDDQRLRDLASASTAVETLTLKFTDQFGQSVEPSALLMRSDVPTELVFYAVASFRNAVAVSAMIDAWTLQLSGGNAGYPLWADYFDFYPFTATNDDYLFARCITIGAVNSPDNFAGQQAPHLPSTSNMSFGLDARVFEGCMRQWRRRFIANRREWKSRTLFRSLEVACQANRMPAVGTQTPTIHDIGVGIALWVSAMEILSHPRNKKVSWKTVLNLLSRAGWHDASLVKRQYTVPRKMRGSGTSSGKVPRVNLIQRLYCELYQARNDFLHGNPVTSSKLFASPESGGPTLLHAAPLIYRAALMAFLPLRSKQMRGKNPATQLLEDLEWERVQSQFEEAVRCCKPRRR